MAHLAKYKEAHPLIFVINHWINLICIFCSILSGLMIHFPVIPMFMGVFRNVHVICGIVVVLNMLVRVVLSLFIKTAQVGGTREGKDMDIKNFLPSKKNRHQLVQWIKYYLFMRKDHPTGTKYGSLQKICYFCIPFLLLVFLLTGLCLWGPTSVWPVIDWVIDFLGGQMNVRTIHYCLMWIMVIFIIIHVYLATIEGKADVNIMLFHKESPGCVADPETGKVIGYDDLSGDKDENEEGAEDENAEGGDQAAQ